MSHFPCKTKRQCILPAPSFSFRFRRSNTEFEPLWFQLFFEILDTHTQSPLLAIFLTSALPTIFPTNNTLAQSLHTQPPRHNASLGTHKRIVFDFHLAKKTFRCAFLFRPSQVDNSLTGLTTLDTSLFERSDLLIDVRSRHAKLRTFLLLLSRASCSLTRALFLHNFFRRALAVRGCFVAQDPLSFFCQLFLCFTIFIFATLACGFL
jgi:hypothetical protein